MSISDDNLDTINETNKLINTESNRLISWTLSIFGGSILVIISSDYINPEGCFKYAYFLFIIGWVLLGISVHKGQTISNLYIATLTNALIIKNAELEPDDNKKKGKGGAESDFKTGINKIDSEFGFQLFYFKWGIFTFSLWLLIFLIWFIIFKN